MDLRQLEVFVAVGEELHFGRAAQRLRVAQPAVSQTVRRLEAGVGAQLLTRTSRSVALTDAGAVLLERARTLLSAAAAAAEEAAAIGRGEAGTLDVGFVSSALTLGVPDRIQAFRRAHPGVRVRLLEGTTALTLERVRAREADVGVVRDAEPDPGLDAVVLAREGFVVVLPAGHRLATRRRLDPAALAGEPWVLYPHAAGPLAHRRNLAPLREAGLEPEVVQEASNWVTIFHLVGAGAGITVAPASAAEVRPGTVVAVPLRSPARSEVQLVVRAGEERPAVRAFCA